MTVGETMLIFDLFTRRENMTPLRRLLFLYLMTRRKNQLSDRMTVDDKEIKKEG